MRSVLLAFPNDVFSIGGRPEERITESANLFGKSARFWVRSRTNEEQDEEDGMLG